ncbi:MAG: arginine repressor [Oscillospiraceae bacterium]|jgi:transcriptional regulator of arginine metabolism|nr:arginine repressor [Oscillospiraceae bacterium]
MKAIRHAVILEIIGKEDVETQEELAAALRERGILVTQATVSRDIKELHLLKVLADNGGYKYATLDKAEKGMTDRFIRIFSESVVSITAANNLIVIKTLTGSAAAAAEAVDSMHWSPVVGTLAGDNTIFVAVRSIDEVESVIERFRAMAK